MKLVSMKLPKPTEKEKKAEKCCSVPSGDVYPWGLRLSFDDEKSVNKLPILKKLEIGEEVLITARACVTSLSSSESRDNDGKTQERFSASIQIEQISIERDNGEEDAFNEAVKKG